jgi:hypothetical protein
MKKIACNLREAPEEKRLPNRRLQRSVLVVYVSGSYCAAWAADSSILPLVLLLSLAYTSGGAVNSVPSRALLTFGAFHYKAFLSKVPFSCVVKLVGFLGVSGFAVYGSY